MKYSPISLSREITLGSVFRSAKCRWLICLLAVIVLVDLGGATIADMTLTAAGTAEGFSLSTFAFGFPNLSGIGPLGIAQEALGNIDLTTRDLPVLNERV